MSPTDPKPLPLLVRLPFSTEGEFIEKYGSNVGRGGIFLATKALKPEGTTLAFEFILQGGDRILTGEGVVVKSQAGEGVKRAGMTVQFRKLNRRSRALVDRVVAQRRAKGSLTPDPSATPSPALEATQDPEATLRDEALHRQTPSPPPELEAEATTSPELTPFPEVPEEPPDESGPVLGIDLGSRFARLVVFDRGIPVLVPYDESARQYDHPVVLTSKGGELKVGTVAQSQRPPAEVLTGVTVLLGRRRDDPSFEGRTQWGPATLEEAEGGEVAVQWGSQRWRTDVLVACVLKQLRDHAQQHTQQPLQRVVFAVPSSFHDAQRRAMLRAASLAGLRGVGFVQLPSAAALAFAHERALARKRLLVFQMGPSSFDAGVVEVTGEDAEVSWLIGDQRPPAEVRGLAPDADALERLEAALAQTLTALKEGGLSLEKLDGVLLAGGYALEATLRARMEESLGKASADFPDSASAFARGAAILGQARVAAPGKASVTLAEVSRGPIDAMFTPGGSKRILEASARLPAVRSVQMAYPEAATVEVALFQGENVQRRFLGLSQVELSKPGKLQLELQTSADGLLHWTVSAPGLGARELTLSLARAPSAVPTEVEENSLPPVPAPSGLFRGLKKIFGRG